MLRQLVPARSADLRAVCTAVPEGADVLDLADDLRETVKERGGAGLAAPQIGDLRRVIVINYASTCMVVVNPVVVKAPGKIVTSIGEGCLSFPGRRVDVKRSKRVLVEGFDEHWQPVKIDARNFLAFVFQHEIDHLNGVTIV
jgi:peptide deformylase